MDRRIIAIVVGASTVAGIAGLFWATADRPTPAERLMQAAQERVPEDIDALGCRAMAEGKGRDHDLGCY